MFDVAIIGAGIVGTAIARELSRYSLRILLLDKNSDVGGEATMANSGIVYNGHSARREKLKGRLTLDGSRMFPELCQELDVSCRRTDMIIAAFDEEDDKALAELYSRATANDIEGVRLISGEEALEREPLLNGKVRSALLNPGCAVVDPWELSIALAENAVKNGVELRLRSRVTAIEKLDGFFGVIVNGGQRFESHVVINCAGAFADTVSSMTDSAPFSIEPKRGQYAVLDRSQELAPKHIIAHSKSENEKNILIIPSISGNVLLGPHMEKATGKESKETTAEAMDKIMKSAGKITRLAAHRRVIRSFSGLKAKCSLGDFLIEESRETPGFIHVAGINNPGLTSSPAIALMVTGIIRGIRERNGQTWAANPEYDPHRTRIASFKDMPDDEKNCWIGKDPSFGRIVCRCEQVSEAEIRSAIRRGAGAESVKAVKKRTRAGMGRCQGGFCGPRVTELLAAELGRPMDEIVYENSGSWLLVKPEQ